MRLTADERRRMYEKQRAIDARALSMRGSQARAADPPRMSTGAIVAVTVAGVVALVLSVSGTLSMSLPSTLIETFLPALW